MLTLLFNQVPPVDSSAVLSLDPLQLGGAAAVQIDCSGALALAPLTVAASVAETMAAAAGLTMDPLQLAGQAQETVQGTGALSLDPLQIAGTADAGAADVAKPGGGAVKRPRYQGRIELVHVSMPPRPIEISCRGALTIPAIQIAAHAGLEIGSRSYLTLSQPELTGTDDSVIDITDEEVCALLALIAC